MSSDKENELAFENGLLKAGLLKMELEAVLINARLSHQFNHEDFEEWLAGEVSDEELRPDELELYREVIAARTTFEECLDIARGFVESCKA